MRIDKEKVFKALENLITSGATLDGVIFQYKNCKQYPFTITFPSIENGNGNIAWQELPYYIEANVEYVNFSATHSNTTIYYKETGQSLGTSSISHSWRLAYDIEKLKFIGHRKGFRSGKKSVVIEWDYNNHNMHETFVA